MNPVTVIGAGLAGSEASWQLVKRGVPVTLIEMRPGRMTPAHQTGEFAELVCSNSFRGAALENAVGLLKEEMRRLDSLVMKAADTTRVPAGGALAVNRNDFSRMVTEILCNHPLVEYITEESLSIPSQLTIIATGPLTSPAFSEAIRRFTGNDYFYFYDAAAPIITGDSLNYDRIFRASRYGKGDGAYLNCPFSREIYQEFWRELVAAEVYEGHLPEEKAVFFEGCMPVEVLAKRGIDTLRYGPMKPVGLDDPKTGKWPYAVVQLRPEDEAGRLYNLVGFQTHLKQGAQQRVFRMIPGLEQAQFARFGMMHRNTYINAPLILHPTLQTRLNPNLFLAGQITGVEGYVESAASGIVAGLNCARLYAGEQLLEFPAETAIGALHTYICKANPKYFQPMNINFGLFPPLAERIRSKKDKALAFSTRALQALDQFSSQFIKDLGN